MNNFPGGQFSWGQFSWGAYFRGVIFQGQFSRGYFSGHPVVISLYLPENEKKLYIYICNIRTDRLAMNE